jgi:putative tryptophan/tyrosine transport system substrate-binding protein
MQLLADEVTEMKRRAFIMLLGGAAAWPLSARAQQPAMPVVGFLSSAGTSQAFTARLAVFRQGLQESGYREGQNVAIEYRWAEDQVDRLPALAADLAQRRVSVIVAATGPAARAAKAATTTIPIVFQLGNDPIAVGLVASLNRPGGNMTGVTTLSVELGPKRLELLHEVAPAATVMAVLVNPDNVTAFETQSRDLQAAADRLGVRLHVLHASVERDLDSVFATLVQLRAGGLAIGGDAFLNNQSERLAALALRHAVPAIHQPREFAAAGGLMSYGGSPRESYRLAGVYTGRILKGEKPADLPVQQVTKVELVINVKTAKALGLTVPLALLTRADEVLE